MRELGVVKRSAFIYGFSIFFTGMVNFMAIPVLKHKLGAGEFAYLNLYMNMLLVLGYIGSGWLVQSCIRFYSFLSPVPGFANVFRKLALVSVIITAIISLALAAIFPHYRWMLIAFPAGILIVNLQCIAISWLQASIRPGWVAISEILRSLLFLAVILAVPSTGSVVVPITIWIGWVLSYAVSLVFIFILIKKPGTAAGFRATSDVPTASLRLVARKFLVFGIPLSLWLGAAYCLFFADRFFLIHYQPAALVGHYSALVDTVQKGMGFLLSPLVTAVYPLIAEAHEQHDTGKVQLLSRRILRWQLLIGCAAVLGYIACWPVLKKFLNIEVAGPGFFWSGLLMLAGAATWQVNMMLHKPFELRKQTGKLSKLVVLCMLFLLVNDWWIIPRYGFFGAAIIFYISTLLYSSIVLLWLRKLRSR